eukprot:7059542-Prymnesium_polylepis.1
MAARARGVWAEPPTLTSASSRAHAIFLRLTEVIASWRKKGDNRVRKLILDGIQVPFLHLVIHAVCHPNYADIKDMYTAILSNDIYLSASGCSEGMRGRMHLKKPNC